MSKTASIRVSNPPLLEEASGQADPSPRRSKPYTTDEHGRMLKPQSKQIRSTRSSHEQSTARTDPVQPPIRRSISNDQNMKTFPRKGSRAHFTDSQLTPIPGSPYTTEQSAPPSPTSQKSLRSLNTKKSSENVGNRLDNKAGSKPGFPESSLQTRSKPTFLQLRSPQPQSLNAALEKLTSSQSESGGDSSLKSLNDSSSRTTLSSSVTGDIHSSSFSTDKPPLPSSTPVPTFGGKQISAPIMNHGMSPGYPKLP